MKRHITKLRGAMTIAVLAMSASVLGFALAGGPAAFETMELAPGNHVHYGSFAERSVENMGDNANIGFIVGDDCVLAVDAGGSLAVGQALRKAIRRVTDKPVCYVILTHVHPDHFFGAAAFLRDNPQFVAHENYPKQLAARARPYLNALRRDLGDAAGGSEIVKPTLLVKDRIELDLGGRRVTVQAWPIAHTDDDLTVYDGRTRTLWLSDLLFIGHAPVIDGSITGFLGVMDRLRAIDAEHYVPGHGRSEIAWPAAMDAQQRYFEVILKETRAAIRARKTIQQATDEVGLAEEKNWSMFDVYHRRNVTTAYTELEWE
jgi:quinoprotein relay system zinc metallohydrolase 2